MHRWGLIADDLTGACDAGVQFAERGVSTLVWLGQCQEPADLLVIPTDSRDDPPEEARRKVREACALLAAEGRTLIYKKIDSTLRGNIGPEVEAAVGFCRAFVAPAYPAMGRTIQGGRLFIDGRDTEVELAGVLDAATEADLAAIAARAMAERPPALLVGSAGLAKELARILVPVAARPPVLQRPSVDGPVLVFAGSTHEATARQLVYLRRHRASAGCRIVEIGWMPGELEGALDAPASAIIASGGDTAALVARTLEASGIRLERQILEGIPYGTLVGGRRPGLPFVTKAGGFGRENALAVVAEALGA